MIRRVVLFLVVLGVVAGPVLVLSAPASSMQFAFVEVRVSEAFSPNGDGRRDEAVVRYWLPERGDVSILVQGTEPGDPVVHRSVMLGERAPGEYTWRWDGLDDQGVRAPEGYYAVRLTWTTADGGRSVHGDSTHLDTSIDVRLEHSDTWGLPFDASQTVYPRTEVVRDSVALDPSVEEAQQATVFIKDSGGRTVLSRDVTSSGSQGSSDLVWTARQDGKPLPPGRYRAFIRATDLAGNEGRSTSVQLRVSGKVLQWRKATRVVTPARTARGESYWCWTGDFICGEVPETCGTVAPSAFYHDGLSYRSGECSAPAPYNGAEELHWLPVRQTVGVRGVAAARVAFRGRPTVAGESDAGSLVLHGEIGQPSKETRSSTGAGTGWVRGLRMGQGDAYLGYPPGVLWSFQTRGIDAVDVASFAVTMRYLAVAR